MIKYMVYSKRLNKFGKIVNIDRNMMIIQYEDCWSRVRVDSYDSSDIIILPFFECKIIE